MLQLWAYIKARLLERSTVLGLVAMLSSAFFHWSPEVQTQVGNVVLAVVGLLAVLIPEAPRIVTVVKNGWKIKNGDEKGVKPEVASHTSE